MKKKLIALAFSAAAGVASAQSSVTIFGVLDTTYQYASQAGLSVNRIQGVGGNQFSRLGFRGAEDLGDGLSVGFVLDMGLNIDTGSGSPTSLNNQTAAPAGFAFNRRATVSLISRDWGEIRLGRDFVPTYWNLTAFDPFGTAGAGSVNNLAQGGLTNVSTVQTALRASNSVGIFLPALGGFYGQAMYALGENTGGGATEKDGNYAGVRVGYAQSALNVAIAHGKTTLFSGDVTTTNAGVSYEWGIVKAYAQYFRDSKGKIAAPNHSRGALIGAQISMGSGYIPLSFSTVKDNSASARKANQIAIGYVHNLSKRTALYTTYSRLANKNGAALSGGGTPGVANTAWRAIDVGIRHTF